jgi:predicted Abi (CAAX) family protease
MEDSRIGYVIQNKEFKDIDAFLGANDVFVSKVRASQIFPDRAAADRKIWELSEELKISRRLVVKPVIVRLEEEKFIVKDDKQKLVDICFEMVMVAVRHKKFQKASNEELAAWVATQLKDCGYPTTPCGASWGVLNNK